ncbi:MAG: ribonuclease III [Limisphaerales bacterium]
MSDIGQFQQRIGHQFADDSLLRLALTHPSVGNDQGSLGNNQRLEFLGDAVLQLILSDELYRKFPHVGEGLLTKTRAELVNRDTLAAQSRAIGLDQLIDLSKGEEQNQGRTRPSILADAYEAFIGAVYLDGGYEAVTKVVLTEFADRLEIMDTPTALRNPKGELQELLQAISTDHPHYEVVDVSGPDHDREFQCTVNYRGKEIGRGGGKSKKAAESNAASEALDRYRAGEISGKLPPV